MKPLVRPTARAKSRQISPITSGAATRKWPAPTQGAQRHLVSDQCAPEVKYPPPASAHHVSSRRVGHADETRADETRADDIWASRREIWALCFSVHVPGRIRRPIKSCRLQHVMGPPSLGVHASLAPERRRKWRRASTGSVRRWGGGIRPVVKEVTLATPSESPCPSAAWYSKVPLTVWVWTPKINMAT